MSIWRKLADGAAALAGPLGTLFRDRERPVDERAATRDVAFTIGVIVLAAKMAKADGLVSGEEAVAFRQVFAVPAGEERNVAWVFDRAKRDAAGFEPYARQIARLFSPGSPVLEELLDALFHIAGADGAYHAAELDFLAAVARIFGFDDEAFARIRAVNGAEPQDDPYHVLGVPRGVGEADLRAAWRRLAAESHPDRLLAAGMPEEFIRLANERLQRLNGAYERIRRERAGGVRQPSA